MSPANLTGADRALIVVYFAALLAVGLAYLRRERSSEGYLLAGRTLTLPAFVATLVSTWYGGILGVGEYAWQSGVSMLTVLAVPYYVSALVFALWLAPRIRAAALYTIPDKLAEAYGRPAGLLGAVFTYGLSNPAPYVLALGVLLQLVFGLGALPAMVVGVVLSTVYVYAGGFRADVRVNLVQFVLMFLGFGLILPYCATELGPLGWVARQVPPLHLTWHGGNAPQYLLAWAFIALWALIEPSFHQRCYAARDPRTAQRGVLVSILFWMLFDAMTCTAGLYARAALPELADPLMAYPALADRVLPPIAKGIFYTGMLATVMSTLVSFTFQCGVTFARDMVWRLRGGPEDQELPGWTAVGLVVTSALAVWLAWRVPSVVDLWYNLGTTFIPALLLPLLTAYAPAWRATRPVAWAAMALAPAVSLAWLLAGQRHLSADGWPQYPLGLEPMYPGLLVSLLLFAGGWLAGRRVPAEAR